MTPRNSQQHWGWLSRGLHWSMALLLVAQITLGRYAHELDRSAAKLNLLMWHKSIGICLLTLVMIRLAWALANPRPNPPLGTRPWQFAASRINHAALYLLMLAIPVSGWLMNSAKNIPLSLFRAIPWPDLISPNEQLGELFEAVHESLVAVFIVFAVIHAGAALWHHFIRHDIVLRRMLLR